MSRPDIFGGVNSSKYTEFTKVADIALLVGDVVAIAVIAFVILSSPVRYFIRKRRCCVNVSCCGKKEEDVHDGVVRRVESVLRDAENNEANQLSASDKPSNVKDDARNDNKNAFEMPVIELPAVSVVARTGSQIMRRHSGRFESFSFSSDSIHRSDSIRRSSGTIKRSDSVLLDESGSSPVALPAKRAPAASSSMALV